MHTKTATITHPEHGKAIVDASTDLSPFRAGGWLIGFVICFAILAGPVIGGEAAAVHDGDPVPAVHERAQVVLEPARERAARTGEGSFEELKHVPYLRFDQYLVERIGVPLRSRLMQMCHVVTIKAPDHRAAHQASTLEAIRRSAR